MVGELSRGLVLVLTPFGGRSRTPVGWGLDPATRVDELRARGSRVDTILPDSTSGHMFGASAMDLSRPRAVARAGHDQGSDLAEQITELWR